MKKSTDFTVANLTTLLANKKVQVKRIVFGANGAVANFATNKGKGDIVKSKLNLTNVTPENLAAALAAPSPKQAAAAKKKERAAAKKVRERTAKANKRARDAAKKAKQKASPKRRSGVKVATSTKTQSGRRIGLTRKAPARKPVVAPLM